MSERLYIIGNGFDLYHGIPSSYAAFGNFVRVQNRRIADVAEDFIPAPVDETLWSRLEENLAYLDADQVAEQAEMFLTSPGSDDWKDSANHDYQWQIRETVDALSVELKKLFFQWLQTLSIPSAGYYVGPRLDLTATARFLTFNYTPTLASLYGVPAARTLHIHGQVAGGLRDIVLGHGWERPVRVRSEADADMDSRILEGEDILDEYFTRTFKPAGKILAEHTTFFDALVSVREVCVLGHALSEVDMIYLDRITAIAPHAEWRVSYFESPREVEQRIHALGVPWRQTSYLPIHLV